MSGGGEAGAELQLRMYFKVSNSQFKEKWEQALEHQLEHLQQGCLCQVLSFFLDVTSGKSSDVKDQLNFQKFLEWLVFKNKIQEV